MRIENFKKQNVDKKLIEVLESTDKDRIESYNEALKRLIRKDKEFENCISEEDIQKLAQYKDEEISNRLEIRALKQERQKILNEEKKKLSKELAKEVGVGMENSIDCGNAVIKAVLLGVFGGPVGITLIACKELIMAEQTKKELKMAIVESIENGSEADVHNLIAEKDREYGKLLNFSGFMRFIKKSDVFIELVENEEEKNKIIESMKQISREAFEVYSELENYKDEILIQKEQEKFEEDEEDPEPEIGMKIMM